MLVKINKEGFVLMFKKENYSAFWENEGTCFCVEAPDGAYENPVPDSLEQLWFDNEFILNKSRLCVKNRYYGGDALPYFSVNTGPGVIAAFLGNPYKLAADTVWFDTDPMIKSMEDELPALTYSKDTEIYKKTMELTEYLSSNSDIIWGLPDLGGGYDILASLRGSENLLYDLYDYPEQIHTLMKRVVAAWKLYYEDFSSYLLKYYGGMTTWMPIWNDKRWAPLQCDFCAMISPDSFRDFVAPYLADEAAFLDNAVYHLDGPGELPHLDYLLDIDKINAIQWTPGAGDEGMCSPKWFDLYKKIQSKNKGLILLEAEPDSLLPLLENVSHKGLYVRTICETKDQALALEREANKILGR